MLVIAFICFLSLIVGWLLAPTSAPRTASEPMGSTAGAPEPGTSLA